VAGRGCCASRPHAGSSRVEVASGRDKPGPQRYPSVAGAVAHRRGETPVRHPTRLTATGTSRRRSQGIPLSLITGVYVSGSYARGAGGPHHQANHRRSQRDDPGDPRCARATRPTHPDARTRRRLPSRVDHSGQLILGHNRRIDHHQLHPSPTDRADPTRSACSHITARHPSARKKPPH
jgi:hypothetical protein